MKKQMKSGLAKIFVILLCVGIFSAGAAVAAVPVVPPVSSLYQLRDVSGQLPRPHPLAGSQWFANVQHDTNPPRWTTLGGDAPGTPMYTWANLVTDFAPVNIRDAILANTVDGPLQSAYLVMTGGQGKLDLRFAYGDPGREGTWGDVLLEVPGYTTDVSPRGAQQLFHDRVVPFELDFKGVSPWSYGSQLGWLTFRQSANSSFSGYRESIKIPLVAANVFDGKAEVPGNELYFDLSFFDGSEIVTRRKFRWGAGQDENRYLGTFFINRQDGALPPTYSVIARVTNRTGVRYRRQRYDRDILDDLYPSHWEYDIPYDLYGTLPQSFDLDRQSQIAPGLVTAYSSTANMTYNYNESFRLYPFDGSNPPYELRLESRVVRGTSYGVTESLPGAGAFVEPFSMNLESPYDSTRRELAGYAGGNPVMPETYTLEPITHRTFYPEAFYSNSFMIATKVPPELADSGEVPVLPMRVRMRISRRDLPAGRWHDAVSAENVGRLAAELPNICTIWVYSENADDLYANLFTALSNRGRKVEDCVQAFTHNDYLYVDFIVLMADAVSRNTGRTAFIQVVEHNRDQYIYIGDGRVDDEWTLGFFVTPPETSGGGGGGGGSSSGSSSGCDIGGWGIGIAFLSLSLFLRTKRSRG